MILEFKGIVVVACNNMGGCEDEPIGSADGQNMAGFGFLAALISDRFATFLGGCMAAIKVEAVGVDLVTDRQDAVREPSGVVTQLTDNAGYNYLPSWSPDGQEIIYTELLDGDIFKISSSPSEDPPQNLTSNSPDADGSAIWSNTTTNQIAFLSSRDGLGTQLYLMNADGSNVRRLTTLTNGFVQGIAWSPDDGHIIFFETSFSGGASQRLHLVNNPTSASRTFAILINNNAPSPDDWSPSFAPPPLPTPTPVPTATPTSTPTPVCTTTIPYSSSDPSEPVNIRNAPNSDRVIGLFYGREEVTDPDTGNILIVEWTPDRNVSIIYMYYDGTSEWYLINYYGSLGWVADEVIDNENGTCVNIPLGPPTEIIPSEVSLLPIYSATDPVPNPNDIPVPFGPCTSFGNIYARTRCSYDVYVKLYDYLNSNANPDDNLLLQDVLSVVMMYELGVHFDNYSSGSATPKQMYMMEAIARNLSQVCAQERLDPADGELECDMRGIINWLSGLHGWYDQAFESPQDILFANQARQITSYAPLSRDILNNTLWLYGLDPSRPFTWGNWSSSDELSVAGFNATSEIIDQYGDPVDCAQVGSCPLAGGLWYGEKENSGICEYNFAVTGEDHSFGPTGNC